MAPLSESMPNAKNTHVNKSLDVNVAQPCFVVKHKANFSASEASSFSGKTILKICVHTSFPNPDISTGLNYASAFFFSNGLTFCMLCFPCFASLRSTVPPHFSSCRPSSGFLHFRMCQPAHNNTCQMDAAEVGTKAFTTRISETWIKTYFLPRWKVK